MFSPPIEGLYTLDGGNLTTESTQIGYEGVGTFNQNGGLHETEVLWIGNVGSFSSETGPIANGFGIYQLADGTLNSGTRVTENGFGQTTRIGLSGQGTFTQTGGVHNANQGLIIGANGSSEERSDFIVDPDLERRGTYSLSSGTLNVRDDDMVVGAGSDFQASGGLGFFNQTGGQVNVEDNLILGGSGDVSSGEGHYRMEDGNLDVDGDLLVGLATAAAPAKASFVQTGGNVDVAGDIKIGESGTDLPANVFRMNGGTTSATNVIVGGDLLSDGLALFEINTGAQATANILVNENGILQGDGGTIIGNVTVDGGTISPGNSPGTLSIDGDFEILDGILELELFTPTTFDILDISGEATFGEDALVQLVFGYIPDAELDFSDYVMATDIIGLGSFGLDNFDIVFDDSVDTSSPFSIDLSFGNQLFSFDFGDVDPGNGGGGTGGGSTEVSEPATMALLGISLMGLGLARRRKAS